MREINECTAEVFRRSEKRIKERKRNRNRILKTCVGYQLSSRIRLTQKSKISFLVQHAIKIFLTHYE